MRLTFDAVVHEFVFTLDVRSENKVSRGLIYRSLKYRTLGLLVFYHFPACYAGSFNRFKQTTSEQRSIASGSAGGFPHKVANTQQVTRRINIRTFCDMGAPSRIVKRFVSCAMFTM